MSMNTFGHLFQVTTWGESHGPAIGATIDGCPPGIRLDETIIQPWLDKRKPGQSKFTTQRREADNVEILSGVFEGKTTGTPIQLTIRNTDQRSKDYGDIANTFRPAMRISLIFKNTAFAIIAGAVALLHAKPRRASQRGRWQGRHWLN